MKTHPRALRTGFPFFRPSRTGRKGISLIEVLVALAVFALAFVGMGRVLAGLVDAAGRVERARYVQNEMESRMVHLRKGFLQPLKEEQQPDARGVKYILEVKPLEVRGDDGRPLPGFYSIRVEALWGEGSKAGSDVLEVTAYQP